MMIVAVVTPWIISLSANQCEDVGLYLYVNEATDGFSKDKDHNKALRH